MRFRGTIAKTIVIPAAHVFFSIIPRQCYACKDWIWLGKIVRRFYRYSDTDHDDYCMKCAVHRVGVIDEDGNSRVHKKKTIYVKRPKEINE